MRVFDWRTRSDLALAPAEVPLVFEHRVPTFEEFCAAHPEDCFSGARPFAGRVLIIRAGDEDVGFVSYGGINLEKDVVVLDAWLASTRFRGRGYGSAAIALACRWLQAQFGVDRFLLRPSRRNVHALRAARRAGFREAGTQTSKAIATFGLAPAEYADEVLLFLALPPPRATLEASSACTYVFFDGEFTNLDEPEPISIGAVATDATAFYCELQDWPVDRVSDFVREAVLPLLDGDAVPAEIARESFGAWLAERAAQRPVTLISDSGFDRFCLTKVLGREDLPLNVQWRRVPVAYQLLDEVASGLGLRRHHALDDARALRHALLVPPDG